MAQKMSISISTIFFILITIWSGMRTTKNIELTPTGGEMVKSQYISRFAVPYDASLSASVRVKLHSSFDPNIVFPLTASFYDDDEWNEALHSGNCEKTKSLARYNLQFTLR